MVLPCPRCGSPLIRVRRRGIDRLISLAGFAPEPITDARAAPSDDGRRTLAGLATDDNALDAATRSIGIPASRRSITQSYRNHAVRESASPSVDHAPVASSTGTATEIRFAAVVPLRSMQLLPCRKMRPGLKAGLGGLVPLHAMELRLSPNDPILWS